MNIAHGGSNQAVRDSRSRRKAPDSVSYRDIYSNYFDHVSSWSIPSRFFYNCSIDNWKYWSAYTTYSVWMSRNSRINIHIFLKGVMFLSGNLIGHYFSRHIPKECTHVHIVRACSCWPPSQVSRLIEPRLDMGKNRMLKMPVITVNTTLISLVMWM